MSSISFDNAYLLLLILPLFALVIAPFVWAVRKENKNGHNIASCVIHIVMAVLIAFTAAGAKIETVVTETNVYVVADVSYSSNRNLDKIDGYIQTLSGNLPKNSRMGVVCFGKDYKLITRLGESFSTVKNSGVDDSATDIVAALDYAGSLFTDGVIKRIVLITDGRQTGATDSNALKRAVDNLTAVNIHVDAIYLDNNLDDGVKEVQLSSVEYTRAAYLNHSESVTATVESNYVTEAIIRLLSGDEVLEEKAVSLNKGVNTVLFSLNTDTAGEYDYEVRVLAEGDENPYNNSNYFTQKVTGSMRVLLISGNQSDISAIRASYGELAQIDAYIGTDEVPCSVEELCTYDEIVLSDVDIASLRHVERFQKSLDIAVSMFGKSLLTFGNVGLQNASSDLDPIKDMLPVNYGSSASEGSLYTLVIDASRSMLTNSKFIYAKRAALALIDLLDEGDDLSVVIFYGDVSRASLLAPVHLSDKDAVANTKSLIENLDGTQGTFIGLALSAAFDAMKDLPYADKQVMLISDGLNYAGETDDPLILANTMRARGIVTSVFDVGRGADTSTAAVAAKALLENIARNGGGNYYEPPTSESEIDGIVFGEMADNLREAVVLVNSGVTVRRRYDESMNGITDAGYVSGYVNSAAKASATTVLTTEYVSQSGVSTTVPIYAYWKYGNGRVSSFTSGLSGEWISSWHASGLDMQFFANVFNLSLPQEQAGYPFILESQSDSGYTRLLLTPAEVNPSASVTIAISSPTSEIEGAMAFDSSAYSFLFETAEAGKYSVLINYTYGGYSYSADYTFTVSYLAEYNSFAVCEASVLYKMLGDGGTVSEDGNLKIVNNENEVGLRTVRLAVPFMIACVVLFAADIVVRKLKWNDIKNLFVRVNKG